MATLTSISGPSGTGKSRSQKNLHWESTFVIRPNRKPFPWKYSDQPLKEWDSKEKKGNFIYMTDYSKINAVMKKLPEYGFTKIIIEDSTHLLLEEFMATVSEKGCNKSCPFKMTLIAGTPDRLKTKTISSRDLLELAS